MRFPVPRDKADELEAVLSGRRSISIATDDVRRLAAVGQQAAGIIRLSVPDPTWQASLRMRLLTDVIAVEAPAVSRLQLLRTRVATSARVAVATGTAGAVLGSTGIVAAAASSVPGQLLHPVKLATEQARLLLSISDGGDARLHLSFARERLDELDTIAGEAGRDAVAATLLDLDHHVAAAIEVATMTGDEELWTAILAHLDEQADRLERISELLPTSQRALVDRSNATVIALVTGILDGPDTSPPSPPVAPSPTPAPDPEPSPSPSGGGSGPGPGLPDDVDTEQPGDLVPVLPGPLDEVGTEFEELLDRLLDELRQLAPGVDDDVLDVPLVDELVSDLDVDGLLGD